MIENKEDLAKCFGIDPNERAYILHPKMAASALNEDLEAWQRHADKWSHPIDLEKAISRRVYKYTSCGAWAKLEESIPTGKREKQNWRVIITKVGDRYRASNARRESDRKWVERSQWPKELAEFLSYDAGLDEQGHILDEGTIEFLNDIEWGNVLPVGQKYFEAELDVYTGGYAPGVSFGSIVEGVEACTEVETVAFPCEEEAIWKALQAVEDAAKDIWMETHGCPKCWDGETVWSEYGDAGPEDYGMRPVDENCLGCKGHGIII